MSLEEAYSLAHSANCRLQMAASRPDRNLRFVVGHLMHYESLRLRIVEIEHDINQSQRAKSIQFQGTGQVNDQKLRHKPSTGQLGRKSPPPPVVSEEEMLGRADDEDDNDNDDNLDDFLDDIGADGEDLGLTRFPSGTARPPRAAPELEPDDGDYGDEDEDEDEDELVSPEEPDQATLEQALKGNGSEVMATSYESVRNCDCHGRTGAPKFERVWELPKSEGDKEGVTRAVAQVV